jgi:hypothetical protein
MPEPADVLSVLHLALLSAFVGVTAISMIVALASRLRIQRTLLTWRSGPLTSFPLGPSLFLLLVGAGFVYCGWTGQEVPASVVVGYPAGGLFWFVAAWLSRSLVVTEYGIIPDVGQIRRAVAWGQVVDYFRTSRNGVPHYVFFYLDDDGARQRLDLPVPASVDGEFQAIVSQKLDARFAFSTKQAFDEESLDEQEGDVGW